MPDWQDGLVLRAVVPRDQRVAVGKLDHYPLVPVCITFDLGGVTPSHQKPAPVLLDRCRYLPPLTQVRATVAAEMVGVSEDRARLFEFQLAP